MGSIFGLKSNLLDQNQRENGLLFMKYLLINAIAKETHTQVLWFYCWGLDNNPWVMSHKFE